MPILIEAVSMMETKNRYPKTTTTTKRSKMKTLRCFFSPILYCEVDLPKADGFWKETSLSVDARCSVHALSLPPSPYMSNHPLPPGKVIKDIVYILGFLL